MCDKFEIGTKLIQISKHLDFPHFQLFQIIAQE